MTPFDRDVDRALLIVADTPLADEVEAWLAGGAA